MPRNSDRSDDDQDGGAAGPRAVLRVPEVLMALAESPAGRSLAELSPQLGVPKSSLHRLLRTLERGGYLTSHGGLYQLGPTSFRLAGLIAGSAPASSFPASARPILEELAHATGETAMLGVLSGDEPEILYVDLIDSAAPIRFTLSIGDRRPLYCAASGKAVLAFFDPVAQRGYLARTTFTAFTPQTTGREATASALEQIRQGAVAFDDGGKVIGAAGIASPIFDRTGTAFASISVAGPSERMIAHRTGLGPMVRSAGERISRLLGYGGDYPPTSVV